MRLLLHRASFRRLVASLVLGGFSLVLPATASAFERQWHLGAGGGFVAPTRTYQLGPAASVHAAYGLSDMFDARAELRGSLHGKQGADDNSLLQASIGVAYKLDIIEWVPYLGVRAGVYRFTSSPAPERDRDETYAQTGGMLGTMLGVDYALSRAAAIGLELDYDTLLPDGGAFAAVLRGEYRWGW